MTVVDRAKVMALCESWERDGRLADDDLRTLVEAARTIAIDHLEMQSAVDEMATRWRTITKQLNRIAHAVYGPPLPSWNRNRHEGAARPVTALERERIRWAEVYGKRLR